MKRFIVLAFVAACVETEPPQTTSTESAFTPLVPLYTLRIHGIATADNDGGNASPVTAQTISNLLPELQEIFARSRIALQFDPATDFETRSSTLLNQRFGVVGNLEDYTDPNVPPPTTSDWYDAARRFAADENRDKVTIFFAVPLELEYSTSLGHWTLVQRGGGGSSSRFSRSVAWRKSPDAADLAHEIGHYMHNVHPFNGADSIEHAGQMIANYIDAGNPASEGLRALDGDEPWVLDTPPDAAGAVFVEAHGDKCGAEGTVEIPVTYGSGQQQTFTLAPDRTLVMSYFKGCPFDMRFSSDQTTRLLDAGTMMNRRGVLGFLPALTNSTTPQLDLLATDSAGTISDVKIARTGVNRVVTATTNTSSSLKLIVWDISPSSGAITRRGEVTVGTVAGDFEITHGGLRQVIVSYRDTGGGLTLKSYGIDASGNPSLRDTETAGGITDLAIVRLDQITFVTPVQLTTGVLRTIAWRIYANGEFRRLGHGDGGTIDSIEGVTAYTPASIGDEDLAGAVTIFARAAGNLSVQTWEIVDDSWRVQLADTEAAGGTTSSAVSMLDFDLAATAVQLPTSVQKVIAWKSHYAGTITRGASYTAGSCSRTASAAIGTRFLATACKRPSDMHQVIRLYNIGPDGSSVDLRHEQTVGTALELAMTDVGSNKVVIATRSSGNVLYLRTFAVVP